MIGWVLRRWQKRYPGPVLAISVILLIMGLIAATVWVLRDLSRSQWVRPALGVLLLAVLSLRLMVSFNPRRR